MQKKLFYLLIVILVSGLGILGILRFSGQDGEATDYSNPDNWLSLPPQAVMEVDIFYLYPTVYHKQASTDPDICEVNNDMMRFGAQMAYKLQATAFETVGNIYSPYYRQGDAAACLSLTEEDRYNLLSGAPEEDAMAAFDYYIKHFNNGRPFILAGHSQGSEILLYLLSDYMGKHPDVYKQMIAAYAIGYSVTEDYLAKNPHLRFAENATDTGVIISYNTQAPEIEGKNLIVSEGALVINPISWTRNEAPASASENLGSYLPGADGYIPINPDTELKKIMGLADARVDSEKGVLVCSSVDAEAWFSGNPVLGKGVYHSYDYSFYYYNLRQNAADRARAFLDNNG
ncbi:MAG: DUF3089 domain-containing protein [Dehalococcoides mccartyi]|uniref:DUF3089 domain-containing protein n=1 Tax=Dehalococcoides mccartyi TaxID=61435 RepID=UPI0030FB1000